LENLVFLLKIGILAAILIASIPIFIKDRRLNAAQSEFHQAMRQVQSQAKKEKLTWQTSFREQNCIFQRAVHPATVIVTNAVWNNLYSTVHLGEETTLQEFDGVRSIQFDYLGSVKQPRLGRITISSKSAGKAKRCVFVSTISGPMRTAKERSTADNGRYFY
jgi:type II secretory pathway pseudopilin PulG